jgi:DNA processing protein
MAGRPGSSPWVVLALSGLPGMGPRRLAALLAGRADPAGVWQLIVDGRPPIGPALAEQLGAARPSVVAGWVAAAEQVDLDAFELAHREAGVQVTARGHAGYPRRLRGDREPPGALCRLGDPAALERPTVAIVGTRRCTRYGIDVAHDLGRELAAAGVAVVSGLALGIDGAAHAGALAVQGAPPVAVVATGLDVVYPRRHASLWRRVASQGAIFSEYPLGTRAQAWRFPARNRIVAALADVVVVVESHAQGGSLYTVDEAERRDRPVMAVPGSVRSAASRGTNDLLADGRPPVRDVDDILLELGAALGAPARPEPLPEPPASSAAGTSADPGASRAPLGDDDRAVLDALGWEPATLEHVAVRTGLGLGALSTSLHRLRDLGHLVEQGGWYEQVAR